MPIYEFILRLISFFISRTVLYFSWYHGKISRFEAEALLKGQPDCSFLLRDSESSRTDYSLSLRYGILLHCDLFDSYSMLFVKC